MTCTIWFCSFICWWSWFFIFSYKFNYFNNIKKLEKILPFEESWRIGVFSLIWESLTGVDFSTLGVEAEAGTGTGAGAETGGDDEAGVVFAVVLAVVFVVVVAVDVVAVVVGVAGVEVGLVFEVEVDLVVFSSTAWATAAAEVWDNRFATLE